MGFEPTASRATTWRSNQLSYTHHFIIALFILACTGGKVNADRTFMRTGHSFQVIFWVTAGIFASNRKLKLHNILIIVKG